MSFKQKVKLLFQAMGRMPYKWCWIGMLISSAVLFSWWDEILIWTLGAAWNWLIIPIYYFLEYAILIPLSLLLAKKTYQKMNLQINLRQVLQQSLKNSLPILIYRKLRGLRNDKKEIQA